MCLFRRLKLDLKDLKCIILSKILKQKVVFVFGATEPFAGCLRISYSSRIRSSVVLPISKGDSFKKWFGCSRGEESAMWYQLYSWWAVLDLIEVPSYTCGELCSILIEVPSYTRGELLKSEVDKTNGSHIFWQTVSLWFPISPYSQVDITNCSKFNWRCCVARNLSAELRCPRI